MTTLSVLLPWSLGRAHTPERSSAFAIRATENRLRALDVEALRLIEDIAIACSVGEMGLADMLELRLTEVEREQSRLTNALKGRLSLAEVLAGGSSVLRVVGV